MYNVVPEWNVPSRSFSMNSGKIYPQRHSLVGQYSFRQLGGSCCGFLFGEAEERGIPFGATSLPWNLTCVNNAFFEAAEKKQGSNRS
jgi:hypothetical protein